MKPNKLKMKNKNFAITDQDSADILFMRRRAGYAKVKWVLNELKKRNLPLYWDILWDSIPRGGRELIEAYMKRWAQLNYINLEDLNERNDLRDKFSILEDPHFNFRYPQRFLHRAEDGSFTLDEDKLKQDCIEQCTYTITPEQKQAIDNIIDALHLLKINPERIRSFFYQQDGKVKPIGYEVYRHANGLASGLKAKEHLSQKIKAMKQVCGLGENQWWL